MASKHAGLLPMNAMMGWNEGVEAKHDAIELAKGFISRRYTAVEASWYSVAPFMGGYIWEVHEGGPGKGYIQSVIKALSEDPGSKFWFPSGDRAFQVMMRDGKPFGILLSKAESLPVMNSGQPPLAATTKMLRAVKRGTGVLAAGFSALASGVTFFVGSLAFYVIAANPGPSVRAVDFSELPHAQWNLVAKTGVEQIVSKLELVQGKWNTVMRPHVVPGLKELREEGQAAIQKARDSVAPVPVVEPDPAATPSPAAAPGASAPPGVPAGTPASPTPSANPSGSATAAPSPGDIPGFDAMTPAEKRRALRERAMQRHGVGANGAELPKPTAMPGDMQGTAPSKPAEGSQQP